MSRPDRTYLAPAGRAASSGESDDRDDWMRRHAEARDRTNDRNVRAPQTDDDWERRHGRCQ